MPLTLFNTLTKKQEEFVPVNKKTVTMYTCGPTVYGRPHIGNYSSFLMADLLRRWLEVIGFVVQHAKNITDVGHLVADGSADAQGEDKVEKQARKAMSGERRAISSDDVLGVARSYEAQYLEDEKALNMLEPAHPPNASKTIKGMIGMIESLIKKGHAYETEDGIYFAVQSFEDYGKLSGNTLANLGKLQESVRIEVSDSKKHPADFALWKKCVGENSNHILRWDSTTGERLSGTEEDPAAGFPGWHIECSVMSTELLGESFDIHTGGEDLIFPHHECEIAQSQCASGLPPVRFWVHRRFIDMGSEKMSKSLGNILSLPDIEERGFSPLDLRYFLLSSHYRSHTQFTWKGLEDAKKARLKIGEWIEEVKGDAGNSRKDGKDEKDEKDGKEGKDGKDGKEDEFVQKFTTAMNEDLNVSAALAVVFEAMAWSRKNQPSEIINQKFIPMLEHTFACFQTETVDVPAEIQALVDEREKARAAGDYAKSDVLRDEIKSRGFVLEDVQGGVKVVPAERRG